MSYQNDTKLKDAYPHLEKLFEKDKLQKPIKDINVWILIISSFNKKLIHLGEKPVNSSISFFKRLS